MTNNPIMKILMKVTISMKTTMTTGQHRVLRVVWSCLPFSNAQFVCSSQCSSVFMESLSPPWWGCTTLYMSLYCLSLFYLQRFWILPVQIPADVILDVKSGSTWKWVPNELHFSTCHIQFFDNSVFVPHVLLHCLLPKYWMDLDSRLQHTL